MRAINIDPATGALELAEVDDPDPGPDEVLIEVKAAGVNRADLLQRRGLYPAPEGASPVLGLECAGHVRKAPPGVAFTEGDRVMALLSGGGYAELAAVDAGSVIAVPPALNLIAAGGFPETFLTAFFNIFMLGEARDEDQILVHGGSGGVGTSAIQLCREADVRVIVTAGDPARAERCIELGATAGFDYNDSDWPGKARERFRGFDVILDHTGATWLDANLDLANLDARIVSIGSMGSRSAELDFTMLLRKRLTIRGSTLRNQPDGAKAFIVEKFLERFGDALKAGRLTPIVDSVFPMADASKAHERMASSGHFGKIILHR
ncbi:MAG: NAD(P)H-quinone oxidoreductase [Acidobacteria bacterium]|nr:NAD(P)H-quinone oxidoreductase [Acidobacteriota bacterium]